jgi:hypothetical protein
VLPGDATPAQANQFGFVARAGGLGDGDNDGHIRWLGYVPPPTSAQPTLSGEIVLFWDDLSSANLITETFTSNADTAIVGTNPPTNYSLYFPNAKIGNGASLVARDDNYFSTSSFYKLIFQTGVVLASDNTGISINNAMTSIEAFAIDSKIDDGMPQSGRVMAAGGGDGGYELNWAPLQGVYPNAQNGRCTQLIPGHSPALITYTAQQGGNGLLCNLAFDIDE